MTLGFEFHPEAQAEFAADVDWYDHREFGVGGRFADAVRVAIDAARESPESWATWPDWDREPEVRSMADDPVGLRRRSAGRSTLHEGRPQSGCGEVARQKQPHRTGAHHDDIPRRDVSLS